MMPGMRLQGNYLMMAKPNINRLPLIFSHDHIFPDILWHCLGKDLQQKLIEEAIMEKNAAILKYKQLKAANAETEQYLRT